MPFLLALNPVSNRDALAPLALLYHALRVESVLQSLRDTTRYVFLDRDGVINRKMPEGEYVKSINSMELIPGAGPAISKMNRAGLKVFVATNQRGISLGLYTQADLENIHRHLAARLSQEQAHLDGIYYCPHARDACDCRKPGPGLFRQAFHDFPDAGPDNSIMVGDSLSDIEAGRNLGMATIFIDGEADTQPEGASQARQLAADCFPSLAAFVDAFLPSL